MDYKEHDSKVTLDAALNDIRKGNIAPCYFIYGDEEYLAEEALRRIVDLILPCDERSLSLFWMDGQNTDIDMICESILTPPLIPGKKVVVVNNTLLFSSKESLPDLVKQIVENIESNPQRAGRAFAAFLQMTGWTIEDLQEGGWKNISDDDWRKTVGDKSGTDREKWLPKMLDIYTKSGVPVRNDYNRPDLLEEALEKGFPEDNCLILAADFVDRRKKIFKVISDYAVVLHFPRVKGEARQKGMFLNAAREILERRGKRLSPGAIDVLGRKTGFNLRESMGELDKLITYAGDDDIIGEGDIDVITRKTKEDSVFDLTSALVSRNLKKALLTFRDLIDHRVHYLMIVVMIGREIRLLLQGRILLKSGHLPSFQTGMNFNKFQRVVYPEIKRLNDKQEKKSRGLIGQHPYVIYNALKNAESFSYNELVGYLEQISNIDVTLKTTGKDPELTIQRLLIEICKQKARG